MESLKRREFLHLSLAGLGIALGLKSSDALAAPQAPEGWKALKADDIKRMRQANKKWEEKPTKSEIQEFKSAFVEYAQMSEKEQKKVQKDFPKWKALYGEQKELIKAEHVRWDQKKPQEKQLILSKFEKWKKLSDAEREKIRIELNKG